jgi:two-component system, cell cycle sensor histidine kinase and response regulator CckA
MTKPPAQTRPSRGTETILLVEDEEALRQLIRVMLERSGYTVLEAADGSQALEICREHRGPIDLLLTDVVMPKMNGQALAKEVSELSPKTKVLFMSGHPQSVIATNGVLERGADLLLKPFTRDSLTAKVREILDRPVP